MKYIVGIDEVGRGPLAGPVTVCAVCCSVSEYRKLKRLKSLPKSGLDSKKIKSQDRKKFEHILKHIGISYVVSHVSNKVIDERGISYAINLAISKNLKKLFILYETQVLLDGGLKAPKEFIHQKTIIKGDEKEKIIAWASILAKVSRDSLMAKLHKKFPEYGLDTHKGYGTKKHRDAIRKYGLSTIHRKTWIHID
ncbi:MAG: ribonuclease HII [Minisyncoccia bacterium]